MKIKLIFLLCLTALLVSSCNSDEVPPINIRTGDQTVDGEILVVNEGNFGTGVGSLNKVTIEEGELLTEDHAYYKQNNEFLGNVVQSITQINDQLWVVINNSEKVVITDLELNKIGEVKGLRSPRYVQEIRTGVVYITDLFQDAIYVVDATNFQVLKEIPTGSWNEELQVSNGHVFVANTDLNSISVINAQTDEIERTITVKQEPSALKLDPEGNVWVLCNGGLLQPIDNPFLFQINAQTISKIDSVDLSSLDGLPSRLEFLEGVPYILSKHVYGLEGQEFQIKVNGEGKNLYQFAFYQENILVTDAQDFVRNGDLLYYSSTDGALLSSVEVGIIPGYIFIKK